MELLKKRILEEGKVLPNNILKVGSFLNQQIDTELLGEMAREIASLFKADRPTKVLTVESSGISMATAIGLEMRLPVVFAKKHQSSNVDGAVLSTPVHSYTHNNDYNMVVSRDYILPGDRLLLADDFLATGNAIYGLLDLAKQAGAEVIGVAIAIEKGFQGGGDELRARGIHVESLALIDSMTDESLTFRE